MFTVSISQGQLSHLEPTQNDGRAPAVLCHSGQREGETAFLSNPTALLHHGAADSCLLQGLLQGCNSMCAGYLFQQDKQYDVTYDTGDKAIQCGRHVDIFKFWLMWKAKVCVLASFVNVFFKWDRYNCFFLFFHFPRERWDLSSILINAWSCRHTCTIK